MALESEFTLVFGNYRLPLDIHSLANEDGKGSGGKRPEFSFRFVYRKIAWTARFAERGDDAVLVLTADVGAMPYSAESVMARNAVQAILESANGHLGPIFHIVDGRIRLAADLPIDDPVSAVGLVSTVTRFLLPLKPYLETIDWCGGGAVRSR